jgi:hypothetical protein
MPTVLELRSFGSLTTQSRLNAGSDNACLYCTVQRYSITSNLKAISGSRKKRILSADLSREELGSVEDSDGMIRSLAWPGWSVLRQH